MNDPYAYGGARVLVDLHGKHLEAFLHTWRRADAESIVLPSTDDPNYASREALLAHVLGCAARYLTWICEQLGETIPDIVEYPEVEGFATRADDYLATVLAAWRGPALRRMTEERAYGPAHTSRWGTPYCIDAMLEHAVMHSIRHGLQLQRLMQHDIAS